MSSYIKYDVVNNSNHKIQIQFDENYNEFQFLNGGWGRKYQNFGHFEYSKSHINN